MAFKFLCQMIWNALVINCDGNDDVKSYKWNVLLVFLFSLTKKTKKNVWSKLGTKLFFVNKILVGTSLKCFGFFIQGYKKKNYDNLLQNQSLIFGNLISKTNSLYSTLRRMRIRLVLNYWMHINDINGKASYFHLIISVYYFWILICMYPLTFKMIDEVETIKRSGFCYCLHSAYIAFWDRQYYKFKKKIGICK